MLAQFLLLKHHLKHTGCPSAEWWWWLTAAMVVVGLPATSGPEIKIAPLCISCLPLIEDVSTLFRLHIRQLHIFFQWKLTIHNVSRADSCTPSFQKTSSGVLIMDFTPFL